MKTAVEWLEEHSRTHECHPLKRGDIIEQAKEMEKQQMIDFADSYGTYLLVGGTMSAATYNETFKSE